MAEPVLLLIFHDQPGLIRLCPERNESRSCRMAVSPDLFGRAVLVRQ